MHLRARLSLLYRSAAASQWVSFLQMWFQALRGSPPKAARVRCGPGPADCPRMRAGVRGGRHRPGAGADAEGQDGAREGGHEARRGPRPRPAVQRPLRGHRRAHKRAGRHGAPPPGQPRLPGPRQGAALAQWPACASTSGGARRCWSACAVLETVCVRDSEWLWEPDPCVCACAVPPGKACEAAPRCCPMMTDWRWLEWGALPGALRHS